MYSTTDSAADTRQLIVHRTSPVQNAMPLFTDHLQLPLFTGQRRWHTMFGQLNQLTSSGCAETATLNADEDILADSNFVLLFDSSGDAIAPVNDDLQPPHHCNHASCVTAQSCQTLETNAESVMDLTESTFPALDENADSVQSALEQFMLNANVHQSDHNTNCESPPVSVMSLECSQDHLAVSLSQNRCCSHECAGRVGSVTASGGSQTRTLRGRRHSDPGSIHSGTTGSLSTSSHSDNWYYYDHRLGPGGPLAAQYGRLRRQRSLCTLVFPPAYDDVVHTAPVSLTADPHTTDTYAEQLLSVSESNCENMTELPPPYQEPELPPSYSEVTYIADVNEQLDSVVRPASSTHCEDSWQSCGQDWGAGENNAVTTRCSSSRRVFAGRPAVRWNRNTRVEQWRSSFNWVMS